MDNVLKAAQGQLVLPSTLHVSPIMSFMDHQVQRAQNMEHGVIPYQHALVIT